MTLREYRQACERTKMNLPKDEWQEYLRIGALGELGELLNLLKKYRWHGHEFERERVVDELGDVLWHVVQIVPNDAYLEFYGCGLGGSLHNVEGNAIRQIEMMMNRLLSKKYESFLMQILELLIVIFEIDPQEVVAYNIAKLQKRYPDGFDEQMSIGREE